MGRSLSIIGFTVILIMASNSFAADRMMSIADNGRQPDTSSSSFNTPNNSLQLPCDCGHLVKSTAMKTFIGAGMGFVGILFGAIVGANTVKCSPGELLCGLTEASIGASVGYLVLEPVGVYLGGKYLDENGSFWGAFLGNTAGCVVSVGILSLTKPDNILIGAGILFSVPIAGSIFGYDIFRHCQ
jgi:hypothetical protein